MERKNFIVMVHFIGGNTRAPTNQTRKLPSATHVYQVLGFCLLLGMSPTKTFLSSELILTFLTSVLVHVLNQSPFWCDCLFLFRYVWLVLWLLHRDKDKIMRPVRNKLCHGYKTVKQRQWYHEIIKVDNFVLGVRDLSNVKMWQDGLKGNWTAHNWIYSQKWRISMEREVLHAM